MRGDPSLRLRFAGIDVYVPLHALGELYYGARRAPRREEALERVREFLTIGAVLLPGEKTVDQYVQVKAELAHIGRMIPENDVWIAAMTREHNLPLATRAPHFAHVSHLTTLAW